MEVGELLKQTAKKKQLQKKRDQMIKFQLKKKQKERINLDQSAVKKGHIQKHKYIQKKKFETVVEKTKKAPVQIQDNVNPNTFLSKTHNFNKLLVRTKEKIVINQEQLRSGINAINAYGISNKEYVMNFSLHFQKEIQCEPRPFLMYFKNLCRELPEPQVSQMVIIVLPSIKEKEEGEYAFQKIKHLNLKAWSNASFIENMSKDKVFSTKVFQQQIRVLVKFQLMRNNKFYEDLLKKGVPLFPIDSKKVPFLLQDQISSYPQYIEHMCKQYVAITRTGQQQIFRLKVGTVDSLSKNVKAIIYELTAKLIERSKVKQNKLLKVSVKTASSINFDLYQSS